MCVFVRERKVKRETNEERQREREGEERLRDERERDERERETERGGTTGFFLRLIFLPALFHAIRFTESDRFLKKYKRPRRC